MELEQRRGTDGHGSLTTRPIAMLSLMVHGLGMLHTGYALVFLMVPEQNLLNPSYAVAAELMPMRAWGVLYGALAVVHAVGVFRSPWVARAALYAGALVFLLFGAFFGVTWIQALGLPTDDPRSHVTPLGAFLGLFCGGMSLLAAMSLHIPRKS